jgi:hypothetical protein
MVPPQPTKRDHFQAAQFSWTLGTAPPAGTMTRCKMRHGKHIYRCAVEVEGEGEVRTTRIRSVARSVLR